MNNVFVKTKNVLKSIELIDNLRERGNGVPGFGLIYSEPGLGKTETCTWFVGRKGSNAAYVRAKAAISHRWFFEMIVNALGAAPFFRFSDLFKQASDLLLETDAMLIIDEWAIIQINSLKSSEFALNDLAVSHHGFPAYF